MTTQPQQPEAYTLGEFTIRLEPKHSYTLYWIEHAGEKIRKQITRPSLEDCRWGLRYHSSRPRILHEGFSP